VKLVLKQYLLMPNRQQFSHWAVYACLRPEVVRLCWNVMPTAVSGSLSTPHLHFDGLIFCGFNKN
jgi:hypothetical protein